MAGGGTLGGLIRVFSAPNSGSCLLASSVSGRGFQSGLLTQSKESARVFPILDIPACSRAGNAGLPIWSHVVT